MKKIITISILVLSIYIFPISARAEQPVYPNCIGDFTSAFATQYGSIIGQFIAGIVTTSGGYQDNIDLAKLRCGF